MTAGYAVRRDESIEPCPVRRLGVFGPTRYTRPYELARAALAPLVDGLAPELRPLVAQYLRSGTTVLSHLGYTADVLEYRFGVDGGSAVLSDGVYYWRRDAAEYVRTYGIALDPAVISHMRAHDFVAPALDAHTASAVDRFLSLELG